MGGKLRLARDASLPIPLGIWGRASCWRFRVAYHGPLHDFSGNQLFELAHGSNVVAAVGAFDMRIIGDLSVEREAVIAANGTGQFDTHR